MAGDAINIWGKSYHKKPAGGYTSATNPLSVVDLMNLLASSPAAIQKGISGTQISQLPGFPAIVTNLLNNQPPQSNERPRASINWVILDEQFKYVSGGFDMVETALNEHGAFKDHIIPGIAIPKNGYIYVYCSNESQYQVFFDNLQVVHDRGPILEETHYYPFGLVMQGISSKAASITENKLKYNGKELQSKEFSDGSGLEIYDTKYRGLDCQLGRWWQIDLHAEYNLGTSPYAYVRNNPLLYNGPFGLDTVRANVVIPPGTKPGEVLNFPISGGGTSSYIYDPNNPNAVDGLVGNGMVAPLSEEVVVGGNSTDNNSTESNPFPWLTATGTALLVGSHKMYNKKSWYSVSQNKFYDPKFYGNQYTAGGKKAAKATSVKLTRIGYGLGVWSAYDINNQYQNGEISGGQMVAEQGTNVVSPFGGIYGAAWGLDGS